MDFLPLLKHSLYIDGDYEDEFLNHLIDTAKETIMASLEGEIEPLNNKFKQAVILLAGHYYENRLETTEKANNSIPFGVNSLILHLRGEGY